MSERCDWTDLHPTECAHCRGNTTGSIGEPRRFQEDATGRRVWPEPRTLPVPSAPPPTEEPTDDPRVKVARHLRAIRAMTPMLGARGEDLADSDLPGGDATVALGPVASPATWERRVDLLERAWLDTHDVADPTRPAVGADEDDSWEPPLQTLLFWSEDWRNRLDMDYGQTPTLTSEASFLANADVLAWAWSHEPRFADFVDDIAAACARLENVVRDGLRETRSRVVCDRCAAGKRLILVHGKGERPDQWKCPACKVRFDADALKRALARQMRAQGAEKWVEQTEAIGALRVQGWQERVVRKWIEELTHQQDRCTECGQTWPAREHPACPAKMVHHGELTECGGELRAVWGGDREDVVEGWCDVVTRRTMLWWPSMWRKHLVAAQAKAARRSTA